jgi:hypothetical protein
MAAKGYCTVTQVANLLGREFTAVQAAHCVALIERVEAMVDNYTNRAWLTGPQVDETYHQPCPNLFLRYAPVDTIAGISGRLTADSDYEALVSGEDYEVYNLEWGLIIIKKRFDRVKISYTPVAGVPADIVQASADLVANLMQNNLRPDTYGLDSYSLPDLTVKFARSHTQEALTPTAAMILDGYRYRVTA